MRKLILALCLLPIAAHAQSTNVKIWDGTDVATVTGNALDVNATLDTTGLATEAKQDTGNTSLGSIEGDTSFIASNIAAIQDALGAIYTSVANIEPDTENISLHWDSAGPLIQDFWNWLNYGFSTFSYGGLVGTVQTVKGSEGNLTGWQILNSAGTICYLQFFDTAGAVTLGTTVPTFSMGWPAGAAANVGPSMPGIYFGDGLKVAATTTRAGSTPCGTGMDVNLWYR